MRPEDNRSALEKGPNLPKEIALPENDDGRKVVLLGPVGEIRRRECAWGLKGQKCQGLGYLNEAENMDNAEGSVLGRINVGGSH